MVTSQEVELLRVLDFKRQQKHNDLDRLLTSVNVVADEQVVFGLWRVLSIIEDTKEIGVLTVNVTHDVQRLSKVDLQFDHHCLFFEYFLGLLNKPFNSFFWKFYELTQILWLNLNKLSDDRINCKVFLHFSGRLQPIPHAHLHSRPVVLSTVAVFTIMVGASHLRSKLPILSSRILIFLA